jgi:hypothetical protein
VHSNVDGEVQTQIGNRIVVAAKSNARSGLHNCAKARFYEPAGFNSRAILWAKIAFTGFRAFGTGLVDQGIALMLLLARSGILNISNTTAKSFTALLLTDDKPIKLQKFSCGLGSTRSTLGACGLKKRSCSQQFCLRYSVCFQISLSIDKHLAL